jgi:hypothetical protein
MRFSKTLLVEISPTLALPGRVEDPMPNRPLGSKRLYFTTDSLAAGLGQREVGDGRVTGATTRRV